MKVEKPVEKGVHTQAADVARPAGEEAEREGWGWTRRQRIGLGILTSILLLFLVVQYVRRPVWMEDGVKIVDSETLTLPVRMDPNVATVEELGRIPHVGDTLARRIIEYREARRETAAEGVVFRQESDLDAVPGIGPRLIEEMRPFLRFPVDEN